MVKNILIITRANYPSSSWGNRVRMIAKGLIENGVNVKVLVTHPWPTKEIIQEASHDKFVKFLTKPTKKRKTLFSIFRQITHLFKLKKELKYYNNLDFILLTGDRFLDNYIVSQYCKKTNTKLYVEIVDEIGKKYDKEKYNLYDQFAILNRRLFNLLLHRIDKLFVISSYLNNKYAKTIDNSKIIRTSPTFVNANHYKSRLKNNDLKDINISFPENKVILSYAGSCLRPNGLFFFLENVSKIIHKDRITNIFVVLVLHIGNLKQIQDFVVSLNIEDYVTIYPGISNNYIPLIYDFSDILVLPEQGQIVANAGFPGKVGEYLISGKAIIATNFSDLNTYLINNYNCMISEIGDRLTYIKNLKILINNKEKRILLGKNAVKTGLKYFNYSEAVKIYLKTENN